MTYLLLATLLAHTLAVATINQFSLTTWFMLVASALQTWLCGSLLLTISGWAFNVQNTVVLVSWVANITVLIAHIKIPLVRFLIHIIAVAGILWIMASPTTTFNLKPYGWQMDLHILLSITAYAVLSVSSVLALVLGLQIRRMKNNVFAAQNMTVNHLLMNEEKLFKLVTSGWLLLTCALLSGVIFVDNFLSQGMGHKVTFSLIAWILFALLIFGRLTQGWRGQTAIKLNLLAMLLLAIGYLGSNIVLDYFI